ncbi:MAG: aminomethyltransferase [Saprospiraceae bacterium]|jgi:aminomethyltransferase
MSEALLSTALSSLHIENDAKMVPFTGYNMPVQYPLGVLKEHLHTREAAGLFDVSHMGQAWVTGKDAARELEKLIPIDIVDLTDGEQRYGFFTNEKGGIEDDLMVSRWGDKIMLVVNAACKNQDFAHINAHLTGDAVLTVVDDRALIAIQGPAAHTVLEEMGHDLSSMEFMHCWQLTLNGADCYVTRSGYSGEDGFEISVHNDDALALATQLQAHEACEWIGLGARDSLRLEGGMCLYGHDIDTTTTPVEAAISWAIPSVRRTGGDRAGGFIGSDTVLTQMPNKVDHKRVGIKPAGRAPMREGTLLTDQEGNEIGKITSGGFSPTLGHPIAMGYVTKAHSKLGTTIYAQVRGKLNPAEVSKTDFVKNNFYRI